ncbi:hypothetical protein AALP_AA1G134300 [Arabis alpina]|uniref:Uncharacterized protein n=1 Tax=Arabis alpina TaxID=50452 RepID=A0A087HN05_ARAAL|nr:hypothetical protein AALP_AA1G134300 [Arabis alpina]
MDLQYFMSNAIKLCGGGCCNLCRRQLLESRSGEKPMSRMIATSHRYPIFLIRVAD